MATSFVQKQTFKNQPEEVISEFNFIGGLVKDVHETKLEANQSPNMYNTIFNESRSIKTRNGSSRYNTDIVGSSSDVAHTGAATSTLSLTTPDTFIAQTFVPTGAVNVTQLDLFMCMANVGEEQLVRIEIWQTSAGAPTALLNNAISQVKNVTVTTSAEHTFRFRSPVALSASTTYAIVLKPFVRGSTQTINEIEVDTRNGYASGSAQTSSNSGMSWSTQATDLRFDVWDGGDTQCTGLIRFYGPAGLQQTISKFGASLYRGNDQTGAMTALTTPNSLATSNFIDHTITNETLLVVDRLNRIMKYRGSTNANYTTGTISITNGSATITGSGTSWNTTSNVELGEYIRLPDTKWYRITAIGSNTSMTIETEYTGSTQSGQSYTISPWGEVLGDLNRNDVGLVAPTPQYIENHIGRIWTLTGNTLNFSVLDTSVAGEHFNDFDTANNAGSIIIPTGKGDSGTGLYSLSNVLYVFQRRAIWALYGNSPANFELRNITNEVGMIDRRTLIEWGEVLAFLSDRGITLFDGSNVKNISEGIINTYIDSWANKTTPSACLWENKYVLSFTESGESYNNRAVYFDFITGTFGALKDVPASVWSSWEGGTDTGQIYFGSSNQGTIYRWDIGGNDDGYEIETLYDTPSLGFAAGVNDKAIKKFYLQQLAMGDYSMDVTQLSDINADTIPAQISLSPGDQALYDVALYDVDTYSAEGTILTDRVAEFQGLAKYYKFRMEQVGYDEGIEVLAMVITGRKRRLL